MDLGDAYIDKEELRRRAPLPLIALQLGISLDTEDKALCPFHEDHEPSFRIFIDDRGVERWGCFPCGRSGDVYDLVQALEGLTFPEALNRVEAIVKELPEAALQREAPKRVEWDAAAAGAYLTDAWQGAEANAGWLCVATGLVPERADTDYRVAADQFLWSNLRWGVDPNGNVVMPHYDAFGTLTGIKIRALDGGKWSFPGSKFPALYGSWRPRRSRYVLLTEGEGDMAYATLQSPPVDVLSLPKGAKTYLEEWGQLEADIYFLAFDADEAGLDATYLWMEELSGRDVRICRLPQGHDIKSSRPVMLDLLKSAVKPQAVPGAILIVDGRFERVTNNGQRSITSWYCEPRARMESVDGSVRPAIEVDVFHAGHTWRDIISLDDLASATKMRAWAAQRSLDYLASDSDTQYLSSLLLAKSLTLPEIFQTSRLGSHKAPERYRYTGRTIVAPDTSIGRLPWRYVGPTEAREHTHLDDNGEIDWRWIDAFMTLNEPSVTHPLMAWLIASARRDELAQFPILFLGGSSGSGKTTTARIATQLMGSSLMVSLASVTQFALIRALAGTTTIPVFVDEWSLQSRQDARETVQAVVPVIYDGGVTPRGRADLSVVEYRLTSPVLMAGEDSFNLDREADRMIALRLRASAQNHVQLEYLAGQPLNRFGRWFSDWLVATDALPPVPTHGLTRPEYNKAVLRMGWATLLAYLEHAAANDPREVPILPDEPDLSQMDTVADNRENEYEVFLSEAEALRDGDGLPLVWPDPAGRGTWVRFRLLTSPRNISNVDVELPGRSRAMKQYFADRYPLLDERTTPPYATKPVRATLINGFQLGRVPGQ